MAFNIFATATSDIPLANLDANFTMIGSSAVASTLYPTATTSITYGTAGTSHIFSGSIGAFTLGGTVAGGGNQLNNVIIGTTTPLAGAFTTITGGGRLQLTALGSPPASGSGLELGGGSSPIIFSYNRTSSAYLPLDLTASAFGWSISGTSIGTFSSTGINGMAIGATTPSTGAFTTLSSTGDLTLSGTVGRVVSNANSKRVLIAGGSTATTTTGAYAIFEGYDYGGAGAGGAISLVSAAGTTNPITMSVGGTTRGVFSSTGLAVTGTLSATGALSVNGGVQYGGSVFAALSAGTICGQFANTANGQQTLSIWNKDTTGDNSFISFATETAIANRGSISYNRAGGLTVYNTTSDYRLKEHIIDLPNALETVSRLKPRQFDWKETGNTTTGFIAHELAEVCPHAVTGEKDAVEMQQYEISPAVAATQDEEGNELTAAVEAVMGEREVPRYQGIDTSFLVATLTAAIQEQQAIITALTTRITALEAK